MKTYKDDLIKQHKISNEPVASSNKLSSKFTGSNRIVDKASGNKYKNQNLKTLEVNIRHLDSIKKVNMGVDLTASQPDTENEEIDVQTESDSEENDVIDDTNETHVYMKKLRSHTQRFTQSNSNKLILTCNIT